jgi:hypothetical protein
MRREVTKTKAPPNRLTAPWNHRSLGSFLLHR